MIDDFAIQFEPLKISTWGTGGRPTSPKEGMIGYNSETEDLEVWDGSEWITQFHFNNLFGSTGRATGGAVTDAGSETINVAAGTGFIKATDDDTAELLSCDWAANNGIAITTDTIQYVYVRYNGGSPDVTITDDESTIDLNTEFPLAKVVNEGGTLHILCNPWWVTDGMTNIIERFQSEGHLVRDDHVGGLLISDTGTRNIQVTTGTLWSRLNEFVIPAIDTAVTGTVELYYVDSGGTWRNTDVSQWDKLQYNDTTQAHPNQLVNLTNNWYANIWVYAEADDTEIALIYPQAQYANSAVAEAEAPPSSLPVHIRENAILIGRYIIKQNTDTPIAIQSAFTQQFTAAQATDHGNLAGLADDDHSQYHNDTRGDARYYTQSQVDIQQGLDLKKASNLSDLTSASTARTNLELDTMAVETATDYLLRDGSNTVTGVLTPDGNLTRNLGTSSNNFNVGYLGQLQSVIVANTGSATINKDISSSAQALANIYSVGAATGTLKLQANSANSPALMGGTIYNNGGTGTVTMSQIATAAGSVNLSTVYNFGSGNANIQNTSSGIGSVVMGISWSGYTSTPNCKLEATAAGAVCMGSAGGFSGSSGFNVLRASGVGSLCVGAVETGTNNTASTVISGKGAAGVSYTTRGVNTNSGNGSLFVGSVTSGNNTTGVRLSGNGSLGVVYRTSTVNSTLSGSGSLLVTSHTGSGALTVSSSGSAFIGRVAGTGAVSITTGAGNFGIGDAGTTGISATGSINCGQIGQGANTTASSVKFGSDILIDYGNALIQFIGGGNIITDTSVGTSLGTATSQKISFYGVPTITQPTALTASDTATVDDTYGTEERDVINNLRTRVDELESKLQALGLLA